MPAFEIDSVPAVPDTFTPEPWAAAMRGGSFRDLGDAGGLTQYGVVLGELAPGAMSSLRHWHSREDEFVWIVSGELVLVQDGGETPMRAGDAAAFRAGDPDGHHLVNRSAALARYLVVGTRAADDVCSYSDFDLAWHAAEQRFTRRDGTPLAGGAPARVGAGRSGGHEQPGRENVREEGQCP